VAALGAYVGARITYGRLSRGRQKALRELIDALAQQAHDSIAASPAETAALSVTCRSEISPPGSPTSHDVEFIAEGSERLGVSGDEPEAMLPAVWHL
jgi:hypothetical protein